MHQLDITRKIIKTSIREQQENQCYDECEIRKAGLRIQKIKNKKVKQRKIKGRTRNDVIKGLKIWAKIYKTNRKNVTNYISQKFE